MPENDNTARPVTEEDLHNEEQASSSSIRPPGSLRNFRLKKFEPQAIPEHYTNLEKKSRYNAIYYENSKLKQQLLLQKKLIKVLKKKVNRYGKKIKSLEETVKKLRNENGK